MLESTEPLPTLYSRTSKGQTQVWKIVVVSNSFTTTEGILNGKMSTSKPTVCIGKNEGKANATTGEVQAQKEARSRWQKKKDAGYFEDINHIDNETFYEPMLAAKYAEDWDDTATDNFPVYAQPKIDGLRAIITRGSVMSRKGKPYISVPHILKDLEQFFKDYPDAILDGEIYNNDLRDNFDKITSLAKKKKPTPAELEESEAIIEFHIYDYPSFLGNFNLRHQALRDLFKKYKPKHCKLLYTELVKTQERLDQLFEQNLSEGLEGQIVRRDGPYQNKRSKYLLKRKLFQDAEFEVVDIYEGVGNLAGMAGGATIKMDDGRTTDSGIKGNYDFKTKILANKAQLIGTMATCKFGNYTPDGKPRFPVITAWDRGDY